MVLTPFELDDKLLDQVFLDQPHLRYFVKVNGEGIVCTGRCDGHGIPFSRKVKFRIYFS